MIHKIWRDLFDSSIKEGLSIASKEDIEQIIDLLITDKIDPQIFISNLEALLRMGMPSFDEFWDAKRVHQPTPSPSVNYFTRLGRRAPAFPLWFYAAYPDVMVWFHEWQKKYLKSHNFDDDVLAVETAKLFGINIEDETIKEDQIMNGEGKHLPKYLKNLVQSYKDITGKEPETKIKNPKDDIYAGAEFLKMLGSESNYTFIAENTTKYYLELSRNYSGRFDGEASLLAAAGILDAQVYIFMEQKINPVEILNIAKKSLEAGKESLIKFIIDLEVKLFEVDTPNMDIDDIKDACERQRQNIEKAIQKVKGEYASEPRFASDVTNFMQSHQFKPVRETIGIKE